MQGNVLGEQKKTLKELEERCLKEKECEKRRLEVEKHQFEEMEEQKKVL